MSNFNKKPEKFSGEENQEVYYLCLWLENFVSSYKVFRNNQNNILCGHGTTVHKLIEANKWEDVSNNLEFQKIINLVGHFVNKIVKEEEELVPQLQKIKKYFASGYLLRRGFITSHIPDYLDFEIAEK